ncbi:MULTISPECIES: PssE/Cps14G family polysaccharide biosynthesis glycosyltransferase [Metabacillus]|uniref:Beta(1,3)galactosyltransferase EpsH n=2 Tax=Metabacillus TaxID=2675233 RepID=A0A179T6W2_9BACI|nr:MULTISPECIES: PssE/Cps14G family polysaccharide biosynthesis glycosyltransferase [Metabacillus]OAS88183.1 beta(1,3)galactosyltransferase EpsH [Metabacillus litoralis]QNF27386.1 beta(1,3)galactosyltransferase EpsH [Metabacillus sp. KUDC1714]
MIFVTVGSQKFQFNRLLEELDNLVENDFLNSHEIYAQTGYSTYEPKFYTFKKFINKDDFLITMAKSSIIITHGGTGSIINGVKMEKKVIGVPRLKEFGEHVDNHQLEIIEQFSNSGMIYSLSDIKNLGKAIDKVENMDFRKYQSNTENIINILESFLSHEDN